MKRQIKYGVKKINGAITLLSTELLIVLLSSFISLTVLIVLIKQVFYYKQVSFDHKMFDYLLPYVSNTNTVIMQWFTILGSHWFLIPAWVLVFAWSIFIRKSKWIFIKSFSIALISLGLMFGLKLFFGRPRPLIPLLHEVSGLSFPSGHAFMSLVFFGMFIYMIYKDVSAKWLKWLSIMTLALIIFMVGLSRVYLRLHFASDVIAGYCFGILSLTILTWILNKIEKLNSKFYSLL